MLLQWCCSSPIGTSTHVTVPHRGKMGQLKSQACHAQGIEGPGGQDHSFGKPFLERVVAGCAPPSRGAGRSVGWMMPIGMRSLNASSIVMSTSFTRERSIMTRYPVVGFGVQGTNTHRVACLGGLLLPTPQQAQERSLIWLDLLERVSLDPGNEPRDKPS